jgi:hypothetical protein
LYSADKGLFTTPSSVRKGLFSAITSASIVHKALGTFIEKLEKNSEQYDAGLVKELGVHKRQNGLMKYNPFELLSLTYMQKHCSVISDEYKKVKVFTEGKIPERLMYEIIF